MNRFESECKAALRSNLKQALLSHRGIRTRNYGLNLSNTDHSSSLSTYLQLLRVEYEDVLVVICGLGKKRRYKKVWRVEIDRVSCKEFLADIGIGNNYFDTFDVSSVGQRNVWWLQLRDMHLRL